MRAKVCPNQEMKTRKTNIYKARYENGFLNIEHDIIEISQTPCYLSSLPVTYNIIHKVFLLDFLDITTVVHILLKRLTVQCV